MIDKNRISIVAVPALAAFGLAAGALKLCFPIEEAFIHFRYATNIALGYGPVFNQGERVEGFNTPLWEYLLGGLHRLGAPIVPTAHAVGILAGAVTVMATGFIAARLAPRLRGIFGPAAALLVALHPGVLFWTASGMETSLFMMLLLLSFAAATLGGKPVLAGLLCALAALTRLEGLLFGFVAALAMLTRGDRRSMKLFAAALLTPLLFYEIFRLAYYGAPLPNVYYTKSGLQFKHGLWYLWQFVRDGGFIFVLALMSLAGRQRRTAGFWLFSIAAYLGWVVSVGGDFYAFHRFIVPVVPLLAVLAAVGLEGMLGSRPKLAAAILAVGLLSWAGSMSGAYRYAQSAADGMKGYVIYHALLGESIRAHAPAGTTVAAIPMGALPFFAGSEVRVIDMLGLTDEHIARNGIQVPDGLPGHSRYDNQYIIEQRPDLVIIQIDPAVTGLKPLTAEAVRNDPEGLKLFASIAIETGSYLRVDPKETELEQHYALPVQLDFISAERQAQIAGLYQHITAFPLPDKFNAISDYSEEVPVHAFIRRGWSFSRN